MPVCECGCIAWCQGCAGRDDPHAATHHRGTLHLCPECAREYDEEAI